MEISVIVSNKLSSIYDTRYIIVEKDKPEHVLDDAQGYGYKSASKAYAAWGYKHKDKKKEKIIQSFIKNHEKEIEDLEDAMFYCLKDDYNFKLGTKTIKEWFAEKGLEFEGFTPAEFLRVFNRR